MVRQRAADQHGAVQGVISGGVDTHDHAAIVEQQFVAHAAILDQIRVVDADDFLSAFCQRMAGGEGETITDFQLDAFVGEFGDANFRALQVTQQSDEAAVLGGDVAHQLGAGLVLIGRAVGKVQTGNVQASQDQLLQHLR